jgi:hypothetical protein
MPVGAFVRRVSLVFFAVSAVGDGFARPEGAEAGDGFARPVAGDWLNRAASWVLVTPNGRTLGCGRRIPLFVPLHCRKNIIQSKAHRFERILFMATYDTTDGPIAASAAAIGFEVKRELGRNPNYGRLFPGIVRFDIRVPQNAEDLAWTCTPVDRGELPVALISEAQRELVAAIAKVRKLFFVQQDD